MASPITFRAAASAVSTPTTTPLTLTIAKPVGIEQGDVLVAFVTYHRSGGSGVSTCAALGWTSVLKTTDPSSSSAHGELFVHVVGPVLPSDPAAYDFVVAAAGAATMSASGGVLAIAGADVDNPINASAGAAITGSTTAFTAPAVATTVPGCLIASMAGSTAANRTFTPPAGVTERWDRPTPTNLLGCAAGTDNALAAVAGTTGTRAWVASATSRGVAQTVALRPAPAAASIHHNTGADWEGCSVNTYDGAGWSQVRGVTVL